MKTYDLLELIGILLLAAGAVTGIAAAALVSIAFAVAVASFVLLAAGCVVIYLALAAERTAQQGAESDPS